jgi:predicted ATPase
MFTQLRIQNFKSWADTGEFRMAPLTGFFGTNSSGKTAILQFLLMLKQTVESSDRNWILHLGGDQYSYVDLGTTYDISHRHKLPEKLQFSFEWIPKLISQKVLILLPEAVSKDAEGVSYKSHPYNSPLKFDSAIDINSDQIGINRFTYSFEDQYHQWNHIGVRQTNSNSEEIDYQLYTEGELIENWRWNWYEHFNRVYGNILEPFKNYGFQSISTNSHIQFNQIDVNENITGIMQAYEDLFQNTYYLAPLREYPKRIYLWSGENPQDVGKHGASTFSALLSSNKKNPEVQTAVAKALKELGLIDSFRLNAIAENRGYYEVLVKRSPNSAEVLITDVGFGVSQVLPILVLCYYAPKGATLIFEQPEIHLHPSVQAGLADIFIEVIKTRNMQIIIESHSEHLLRRLQRRMAEEKDGFTNDDAALYFCKMNDQGDSELVTLDIDDYGNICNYPEGFFGDEMGDLVAMTEAAINRQMNVGA